MEDYLIKFSYSFKDRAYVSELKLKYDLDTTMRIVLDSGAVCSVISLSRLSFFIKANGMTVDDFINKIRSYPITPVKFISASGEVMYTYPCVMYNVSISGFELKEFYFYLYLNKEANIAVIGADFLQSCKEYKNIGGPIYIQDIDYKLYEKSFKRLLKSQDICRLNDILIIESYKDYAASFRKVYGAED